MQAEKQRAFDEAVADRHLIFLHVFSTGSVYAILTSYACLFPKDKLLLFFFIPAQARFILPGLIGFDAYRAWFQPGGEIDSACHLGGYLTGILFVSSLYRGRPGWFRY
jgi:membrane associated rhomboid family serine protease